MGNWSITIQGIGPHHNVVEGRQESKDTGTYSPDDTGPEEVAKRLVWKLLQYGQSITSATITYGAADNLMPSNSRPAGSDMGKCAVCGTTWAGPAPLPKACPQCSHV
jgi:hypothetical protein